MCYVLVDLGICILERVSEGWIIYLDRWVVRGTSVLIQRSFVLSSLLCCNLHYEIIYSERLGIRPRLDLNQMRRSLRKGP